MKVFLFLTLSIFLVLSLHGQRQLDIQGDPGSTDTVVTIKVNYSGEENVIGLSVISVSGPDSDYGIGGYFYGGDTGVNGRSTDGRGVDGQSITATGVYGLSTSGTGVYGRSTSGGWGVYGVSNSGRGVYGRSLSDIGVYGLSNTSYGVYAESNSSDGVYGQSTSGIGVRGQSTSGRGIYGFSSSFDGVYGVSTSGRGVHGRSISDIAVVGISIDSTGGYFYGGGGIAIELGGSNSSYGGGDDDAVIRTQANQTGGDLMLVSNDYIDFHLDDDDNSSSEMRVKNGDDLEIFTLDESGNLTLTGACACASDRNRKEKIIPVDPDGILSKIAALPITEWQFKGEDLRHLGPMAQDFYAAFGLGQGETTIATVDADGVALAAIQALYREDQKNKKKINEHKIEINSQQSEINHLKKEIAELKSLFIAKSEESSEN